MAKRVESPSSINTFKQCPRKYYYQYIAGLPTLPNIHQVRGNIAHSTLEHFYDTNLSGISEENFKPELKGRIQQLLLQYWRSYQPQLHKLHLHPDLEKFYFEETMLMVMNWVTHFVEDLEKNMAQRKLSLAESFQYLTPVREQELHSDHYSVHGFVDAIKQVGEEVHIIDYKTNSSFEVKDSIRLQLAIYSLLYFEKHGKMPSKVGIFFLRHKLKLIAVDEELLELARKEIELVHTHTTKFEAIQEYPKCVGPLCKWSSGKCDFYDTCKPHEKD